MQQVLSIAASGMDAEELKMSVIAHNLANINTYSFKRMRAEFQDMIYNNLRNLSSQGLDGTQIPTGLQIGHGVRTSGTQRIFSTGDIRQTANTYDLAIEGDGFFQIQQADGQISYTRDGSFKIDSQGRFVNTDGQLLVPPMSVPQNATQVSINMDGAVTATQPDTSLPIELGVIQLVNFINPAGLSPQGHNLYAASAASGQPVFANPGTLGVGRLAQGFIEMSNVKPVDEMVDLIATQRAYEMGNRVLEAANQMMGATSNLR